MVCGVEIANDENIRAVDQMKKLKNLKYYPNVGLNNKRRNIDDKYMEGRSAAN